MRKNDFKLVDWTKPWSLNESGRLIKGLALAHANRGGDRGAEIAILIESGDFLAVCDYELDYSVLTVVEAANCRQALAFFSKNPDISIQGMDPKSTATKKFLEAEEACRSTNDIFRLRARGALNFEPQVDAALRRAQSKIARVLGELPHIRDLKLRFGPGATTLTKKKNASVVEKLQAGLSCSEQLVPYLQTVLGELPALSGLHFSSDGDATCESSDERVLKARPGCWRVPVEIHDGVVEFVPKNAKTHRSIVKEPVLNTLVQLALGDYMTKRLLAFGIDIKDQAINKGLALLGSLTGGLGTLDLSNASDTISTELVHELLPWEWAFMLASCRTETVDLDGRKVKQEKFSSMGNGFTFPLETLIFWALASSVSTTDFASVYGDDIIVKTDDVTAVRQILHVCGFTINPTKSFWTGPFRESCGGDYLSGIDIRPYYYKSRVCGMELFKLHNFYVRQGDLEMACKIREEIHPCLLIYGPDGYGDGHLLGDWAPKAHKRAQSHGYGGVLFDTFQLSSRRDFRAQRKGDRILPVYVVYAHGTDDRTDLGQCRKISHPGMLRKIAFRERDCTRPEGIPERVSPVDGESYKTPSLPGTEGYRRVSIYTLNRPR